MCEQVELGPLRQEHLRAGDSLLLPPGEAAALTSPSSSTGREGTDGYWAGEAPELATLTLLLPDSDAPAGVLPRIQRVVEELSYLNNLASCCTVSLAACAGHRKHLDF